VSFRLLFLKTFGLPSLNGPRGLQPSATLVTLWGRKRRAFIKKSVPRSRRIGSSRGCSDMHKIAQLIIGALVAALVMVAQAPAASLRVARVPAVSMQAGIAAFNREDFVTAARILLPFAEAGHVRAQTHLGFMYSTGRGVPQNYIMAVYWYRRAAEQGDPAAQHMLGLLYDKGQGVPQNYIEAHKWLNLATAHAPRAARDYSARLRDALATKMTRGELGVARLRALEWVPAPER
jgi:TPR repeat protein